MNIVTRKDVAESLDRVVAAALTNPELASEMIARVALRQIECADSWANYPTSRHAATVLHAIESINRRFIPIPPGATPGSPLLTIWQSETAKLQEVTPASILSYLSTTNICSVTAEAKAKKSEPELQTLADLYDANLEEKPSAETLLEIKAHLATIKTPASTANLGVDTERIVAASRVDEWFDAFDLDKWRTELGECGIDVDAIPAKPDAIDCYAGVSMAKLAASPVREIDYLVKDLVVRGQAMLELAHEKTLKSSIMMDLLVSLASGKPFLNYFEIPAKQSVLYLSGENGEDTSLEVFRRVCAAKGIDAAALDNFTFSTWVPKFYRPEDLDELARRIKAADAKFVAADPAGMSISPGAASVVSIAYDELVNVTRAVKNCGATFVSVHHATKEANVTRKGLRSAAGAGWAEWARQWLLLDRVGQFKPETGEHRIRMTAGGSRGHSGRWMLDVREGNVADAGGRVWDVKVTPLGERVQGLSELKVAEDAGKVIEAMRQIGKAATAKAIRTKAGNMNAATFDSAIAYLLDGEEVKPKAVKVKGIDRDGYELCSEASKAEAA